MIVASRITTGVDIGGFILKGNYVGSEYPANMPGRERIAGFEITRNVPDVFWDNWGARKQFEENGLVFGSNDETALTQWCWAHAKPHDHAHGVLRGS